MVRDPHGEAIHLSVSRALWHKPDKLEEMEDLGHETEHHWIELEARPEGRVPGWHQRHVPRLPALKLPVQHAITNLKYFKTCLLQGFRAHGCVHQVWEAVTETDVTLDFLMILGPGIELVSHAPLVASENRPWLENPPDFSIGAMLSIIRNKYINQFMKKKNIYMYIYMYICI